MKDYNSGPVSWTPEATLKPVDVRLRKKGSNIIKADATFLQVIGSNRVSNLQKQFFMELSLKKIIFTLD